MKLNLQYGERTWQGEIDDASPLSKLTAQDVSSGAVPKYHTFIVKGRELNATATVVALQLKDGCTLEILEAPPPPEEMLEEEKKLAELKQQLKAARKKQKEEAMRKKAMEHTLTEDEKVILDNAFAKFDVDKNGTISLSELQQLAKEMKVEMTPEDAARYMKELDKNGDGKLSKEEFEKWWTNDSSRGGNSGVRLTILKKKVAAELLSSQLLERIQAAPPAEGVPLTIQVTTEVGTVQQEASRISVVCVPSSPEVMAAALTEKGIHSSADQANAPSLFFDVLFSVKDINAAVDAFRNTLDAILSHVPKMVKDVFKVEILPEEDNLRVRLIILKAIPQMEKVTEMLNQAIVGEKRRSDYDPYYGGRSDDEPVRAKFSMDSIFETAYASLAFANDLSSFFELGSEKTLADFFSDVRFSLNLRLAAKMTNVVENSIWTEGERRRRSQRFNLALGLNCLSHVDFNNRFANTDEALFRIRNVFIEAIEVAQAEELANAPKQEQDAFKEMLGNLRELIDTYLKDGMGASVRVVDLGLATVPDRAVQRLAREGFVDMVWPVLRSLKGILSFDVLSPYAIAKVHLDGFPCFNLFSGNFSDFLAEQKAARQRMALKTAWEQYENIPGSELITNEAAQDMLISLFHTFEWQLPSNWKPEQAEEGPTEDERAPPKDRPLEV